MSTIRVPRKQRFLMVGEPWRGYERCLKFIGERRNIRITYDRGVLEVVTLTYEHERARHILTLLMGIWIDERRVGMRGGGSTTFTRRDLERGLESDGCYWIANQARLRGVRRVDLRRDPPPDLVIEIDVTNSSVPRMPIYAALGVQEVWRVKGATLAFYILQLDGSYLETPISQALPPLVPDALAKFLALTDELDDAAILCQFTDWVRQLPPPTP